MMALRKIKAWIPRPVFNLYHWVRAVLALIRYGYPARHLTVIGITGTDGKTTTSQILFSMMGAAGLPVSLISTTGAGDLNPHGLRHTPLKRTCLPFHHPSVFIWKRG